MQATIFHARPLATLILSLLILAAFPILANAAILNVPAQYATIGAAVSAASNGDTILVADGTYNASGLLINKTILIESVNGAASTTIDCTANFFADLLASCTIQGFTFNNADSGGLSVITVGGASSTISQCIFTNDDNFGGNGGALELTGGTTTITECTFDHDKGSGAISSSGGSATITNCSFSNGNGQDGGGGGAINLNTGNFTVSGCTFTGNTGGSNAGGVFYWRNGTLTVSDSTFTNNSAAYGGVILEGAQGINSPATFTRCAFKNNSASIMGGVASLEGGSFGTTSFNAIDCTFIDNTAAFDGGAIDGITVGSSPNQVNVTNDSFYGNNVTSGIGTGVICGGATTTTNIVNSILYGDTAPNEISTANPANSITVSFSDVQGFTTNGVNGNIQADPKYAGPATNDLHLLSSSPCIQAGSAAGAPATDFNQYVWGDTVSMGAFSPIHFDFTTPANASQGSSFQFTVTAMAADDTTTITNFADTLHFTSSDASATLPADSTLTNGVATLNATLNTLGNQTITATDTSTTAIAGTSGNIDVAQAGPATHFVVTAPTPVTSYTTNSLTVTAEDQSGNVATGYEGTVHLTSTDPGFVNATGDSTLTNGVGSFNFALKTAGTQTITATDTVNSSITGTSNNIMVVPGPAVRFIVSAPAAATQGSPFNFTVTAQDLFGNTATEYTGTVHFTSTDGLATLPADSTLTNGVRTFNATLNTVGNQAITATDTTTPATTGTSGTIVVATSAVLTTFPAGLQMISAPSDYSVFTVDQIFNPGGVDLAVWQPLLGSYVITPTAPADTIRPGQGYWARFTTPTKLLDKGVHVDETQPFSISLHQGWNMIGDPFAENVSLSQVQVGVNGQSQNFPIWPRPGAPVMSHLYTFPPGATEYQVEAVSLKPYAGYWLFAFKDCTLVIPAR
jgi:uncharacterized membrane protein YgcG